MEKKPEEFAIEAGPNSLAIASHLFADSSECQTLEFYSEEFRMRHDKDGAYIGIGWGSGVSTLQPTKFNVLSVSHISKRDCADRLTQHQSITFKLTGTVSWCGGLSEASMEMVYEPTTGKGKFFLTSEPRYDAV